MTMRQINVSDSLDQLNSLWAGDRQSLTIGDQSGGELQNCIIDYPWRQPYIEPLPYVPETIPYTSRTRISAILSLESSWRFKEHKKSCELSRDLPGVKAADVELSYNEGVVTLSARRSDTGDVVTDTYILGEKYDPDTFQAALDYGVLTVRVRKLPGKGVKQITVKGK